MTGWNAYTWYYIAPQATVSMEVYGWTRDVRGFFDAIPIDIGNIGGSAFTPLFVVKLSQGEAKITPSGPAAGSITRRVEVKNLAGFNATGAALYWVY